MTATNPNNWRSDLEEDTDELLRDIRIDDDILASARQASEVMQNSRKLDASGYREEMQRQQEAEDRNALNLRANLVKKFYEPDRKMALYKLKAMNASEVLVVGFEDANHLRVACNYQQNHHDKGFYTRSFMYGKRKYLEIKRVE